MKQITIYDLLPLLKKGWVACDNGNWWWYSAKPKASKRLKGWLSKNSKYMKLNTIEMKDIAPFDGDWKDSLIKIDHFHQQGKMVKEEEEWQEYQKLQKKVEFSKRVLQKIEESSCEDLICDIADHALFKLNEEAE